MNRVVCLAGLFAACLIPSSAHAARLLTVKIERKGQVVQTSFYEDDGTPDKPTVWKCLGGDPLAVEGHGKIVATEDDPLLAKLDGPVVIRICHAQDTWVQSRIENLTLVRIRPDRDRWFLPPEEVMRTGVAAGLKMEDDPPPMNAFRFWVRVLGIVAFVVMVFAISYLLKQTRTSTPDR